MLGTPCPHHLQLESGKHIASILGQGSTTPGQWTGTSLKPVRIWAAQQVVSCQWAKLLLLLPVLFITTWTIPHPSLAHGKLSPAKPVPGAKEDEDCCFRGHYEQVSDSCLTNVFRHKADWMGYESYVLIIRKLQEKSEDLWFFCPHDKAGLASDWVWLVSGEKRKVNLWLYLSSYCYTALKTRDPFISLASHLIFHQVRILN